MAEAPDAGVRDITRSVMMVVNCTKTQKTKRKIRPARYGALGPPNPAGGVFLYLSVPKFYSVRIGEFTVFLEARDRKQNKEPRAMHLNRRDLDCHPNLRHQIFVFAITPNVLLFHHRDSRMTSVYAISDISGWCEYYASGVGCFRTFSSRRWYSDQFPYKNTRISLRYDETRTRNVKL